MQSEEHDVKDDDDSDDNDSDDEDDDDDDFDVCMDSASPLHVLPLYSLLPMEKQSHVSLNYLIKICFSLYQFNVMHSLVHQFLTCYCIILSTSFFGFLQLSA